MAIVLIVKSEDGIIEELPILRKMTLGRSATCDFRIVDTKISGVHCTFELTPKGELLFSDLDSTNGSYLNNSKVHRV